MQIMEGSSIDILSLLLVSIFSICFLWLAKFHLCRRELDRITSTIPGPRGFPVVGVGLDFLLNPQEKSLQIILGYFEKNPNIFKVWLGPKLVIGISKPEHLKYILNHPKCLDKNNTFYDSIKLYMGNGLVTAPVDIWKKNRKLINPTFNQKILDSFVPVFSEKANKLLEILKGDIQKKNVDVFERLSNCNIDTICETAMGLKVNAQETTNHFGNFLEEMMSIFLLRMTSLWYGTDFIFRWTKYQKSLSHAVTALNNFTAEVVHKKQKEFHEKIRKVKEGQIIKGGERNIKTFLDHLLEVSNEGTLFTEQELRDEVNTFMAAGSDTTAAAICFCFITLGMYPNIQQKIYEEVKDLLGEDRAINAEDLSHLPYMERFIKETLRLFPIAPMFLRVPSVDIDLDGDKVPANTSILLCVLHTHRSAKYWKDPLRFDPDRFLPEEVTKMNPFCYLPFSGGARGCIGSKYAMMAVKSILATLVRKCHFKTEYKSIEEVQLSFSILLRPTNGFKISVQLRE